MVEMRSFDKRVTPSQEAGPDAEGKQARKGHTYLSAHRPEKRTVYYSMIAGTGTVEFALTGVSSDPQPATTVYLVKATPRGRAGCSGMRACERLWSSLRM